MSIGKEEFMVLVRKAIDEEKINLTKEAEKYFKALEAGSSEEKSKEKFTTNGRLILTYMKDTMEPMDNMFKAKDIAEGIGMSSRTVSGAIRKLVTDGYVAKIEDSKPIVYLLTEEGININLDEENNN